ncbi:MAG: NAD-dependent epimerase/dehydratase family protein [Acidimicrobiales bacterium]
MSVVVLTGSAGALGRRVLAGLAASPTVDRVIGLDLVVPESVPLPGVEHRSVDVLHDDLGPHLEGATAVVHLASAFHPGTSMADPATDVALVRRVLDAAEQAGVAQVVLMSSATVYGASTANPIPLSENAPLEPNPGFDFAEAKAAAERLALAFAEECPDVAVCTLRPTTTLAEGEPSWVSAALVGAVGLRAGEVDPPVQFLHFDDLAAATVLVTERGCSGAFNVAPDGWIPPDAMAALAGVPRPRVPASVAGRLAALRWQIGLSPAPPEILPWVMHPWVVANDRLRAEGWEPAHSNEEAYVMGTEPGPLDTLSPKRRQELALGVAAATMVGLGAAGVALVRRAARRAG